MKVADQLLDIVSGSLSTTQDIGSLAACWNAARARAALDGLTPEANPSPNPDPNPNPNPVTLTPTPTPTPTLTQPQPQP